MKRFESYPRSGLRPLVIQGGVDETVDAIHNMSVLSRRYDMNLLHIDEARHHLVNEAPEIREKMWRFLDEHL